jgi:hypothetical protein
VEDKIEAIRERAQRGRYGGHTGSLTVLKYDEVTWLLREIERLREENRRLQGLLGTPESNVDVEQTNLDMNAAQ